VRTSLLVVSAVVLSFAGCKKPPSPAAIAVDGYIIEAAKARIPPDALADGSTLVTTQTGGEPVDGTVEQAHENIGTFSWTRTKVVKESKLPNGDVRIDLVADICMRGGLARQLRALTRRRLSTHASTRPHAGAPALAVQPGARGPSHFAMGSSMGVRTQTN
jgi:hypothetical protein